MNAGMHLFGGSLTRKRRYVMRGSARDLKSLVQALEIHSNIKTGVVYYEIWEDGGAPKRRRDSSATQPNASG